jgi:hypothetical protein
VAGTGVTMGATGGYEGPWRDAHDAPMQIDSGVPQPMDTLPRYSDKQT